MSQAGILVSVRNGGYEARQARQGLSAVEAILTAGERREVGILGENGTGLRVAWDKVGGSGVEDFGNGVGLKVSLLL